MDSMKVMLFIISACIAVIIILAKMYYDVCKQHELDHDTQHSLICNLENELAKTQRDLKNAYEDMNELIEAADRTPQDCTPGHWCDVCEFSKKAHVRSGWGMYSAVTYCDKGRSCPSFVTRKADE